MIEALLARGTLTPEEGRRFKAAGLHTALANMPVDSPGRAVVEALLANEAPSQAEAQNDEARVVPEVTPPPTIGSDLVEQLERLVSLRERGHLTDADFEAAKRKVLG